MEQYLRQIALPEIGEQGQRKIQHASVLIVGVGGLGSPVALYLAAAGIGTLHLVDADVVSLSNLGRQILYNTTHIGLSKVAVAKQVLSDLNPDVQVVPHHEFLVEENALSLVEKADVVVDCCDNFTTRYILHDTCKQAGIPLVYGAIEGWEGILTVFTSESPLMLKDLFGGTTRTPSKAVMGVTPAVLGSLQANEALKIIGNYGEILSNKLLTVNLLTNQFNLIDL
ncbi:MAG: HesA/MoeB/ThiF family protein [Paludibacteraceae bacterium]|nr:HesA/MoeB/ThiF family protein [Paludibacteraceae bacterium]